ncbi:MAG: DUF3617 domain-containing protein [Betaproteobacteria bacterium]
MKKVVMLVSFAWPILTYSQVQPGNWELTVTSQLQGMDKPIGPLTKTQCFTEEDTRDPGRVLGTGGSCQFSNRRESGELYSFDVRCGGALPMSGTGRIRQGASAFEGDLELAVDTGGAGGSSLGMRTKVSGRRLGPC